MVLLSSLAFTKNTSPSYKFKDIVCSRNEVTFPVLKYSGYEYNSFHEGGIASSPIYPQGQRVFAKYVKKSDKEFYIEVDFYVGDEKVNYMKVDATWEQSGFYEYTFGIADSYFQDYENDKKDEVDVVYSCSNDFKTYPIYKSIVCSRNGVVYEVMNFKKRDEWVHANKTELGDTPYVSAIYKIHDGKPFLDVDFHPNKNEKDNYMKIETHYTNFERVEADGRRVIDQVNEMKINPFLETEDNGNTYECHHI